MRFGKRDQFWAILKMHGVVVPPLSAPDESMLFECLNNYPAGWLGTSRRVAWGCYPSAGTANWGILPMNWQPLFPRRNPQAGTDSAFEGMFEKALRQPTNKPPREAPNTTRLARLFALEHDWPLPQPERGRWRRCVLAILGALLAPIFHSFEQKSSEAF